MLIEMLEEIMRLQDIVPIQRSQARRLGLDR